MKQFLKSLFIFLLSSLVGITIVVIGILCFTDTTFPEMIENINKAGLGGVFLSCFVSIATFFIALILQIVLHEGGHLIMGLWKGFKFVSFRIANLTLLKEDEKYKIKKFHIAGTGGQCLLSPPEQSPSKSAVIWYLAGGSLLNLITATICFIIWLFVDDMPAFFNFFTLYMWVIGFLFAIMNGVPLKIGGIGNDGYDIKLIGKDAEWQQGFLSQLHINAASQQGMRLRDMPDAWFASNPVTDFKNVFQVSERLNFASRLIDKKEYEAAHSVLNDLHQHADKIIMLLNHEIACELLFLELHHRKDNLRADELYTDELKKYVEQASKTMSSKQRLLCSWAHYKENRPDTSAAIYQKTLDAKNSYLMLGEVETDLELMQIIIQQEKR